jgi:hypothetical protein
MKLAMAEIPFERGGTEVHMLKKLHLEQSIPGCKPTKTCLSLGVQSI